VQTCALPIFLEAMEEKQVTIQGETYRLPEVFFVVATQNPIEFEGTYPLPEAQQDRFLFKLRIDFPTFADETNVLKQAIEKSADRSAVEPILDLETFLAIRKAIEATTLNDDVLGYITQIVRQTRETESIQFVERRRARIAIAKATEARAYLAGRDYVTPDDVEVVSKPALRHRMQLSPHMGVEGITVEQIAEELVGATPVPR